jgi:hypothetical protein
MLPVLLLGTREDPHVVWLIEPCLVPLPIFDGEALCLDLP